MSSIRKRLKELLERISDDAEKDVLMEYVLQADEKIREQAEAHKLEWLWSEIRTVSQGEGKERPLLYFTQTKERDVYRPPQRMSNGNYNQYIIRTNKQLVRRRDHAKITRDDNVEKFGRSVELFLVGKAMDEEHLPVVRIEPIQSSMLNDLYPQDLDEDDEQDEAAD